jgi:hypothetical protein
MERGALGVLGNMLEGLHEILTVMYANVTVISGYCGAQLASPANSDHCNTDLAHRHDVGSGSKGAVARRSPASAAPSKPDDAEA